jgi:formate hydrogenlyase subunit 3/multisubunit Na+/H+ antiporter MnhD subunit
MDPILTNVGICLSIIILLVGYRSLYKSLKECYRIFGNPNLVGEVNRHAMLMLIRSIVILIVWVIVSVYVAIWVRHAWFS